MRRVSLVVEVKPGYGGYERLVRHEEGPIVAVLYYGKGKFHLWETPPGLYRLTLEPLN